MPLSTKDKMLFERLVRRGISVDWPSENRKFKLSVSPIISAGVDVAELIDLAEKTDNELNQQNVEFELKSIVIFPIVADPTICQRDDFLTRKRVSRSYFVGRNIPFEGWRTASSRGKVDYALANFRDSIAAISDRQLSPVSKSILFAVLDSVVGRMLREMSER